MAEDGMTLFRVDFSRYWGMMGGQRTTYNTMLR
jgi:hypothetical protein